MSCHVMSCHVMSCHVSSCQLKPSYVLSSLVVSCMSCHLSFISQRVSSCHVVISCFLFSHIALVVLFVLCLVTCPVLPCPFMRCLDISSCVMRLFSFLVSCHVMSSLFVSCACGLFLVSSHCMPCNVVPCYVISSLLVSCLGAGRLLSLTSCFLFGDTLHVSHLVASPCVVSCRGRSWCRF